MTFDAIEQQVLKMLLTGEDEVLRILRDQVAAAEVTSRQMTGVGFFTDFEVPPGTRKTASQSSIRLSDVVGTANGLEHGFGFVLFVDDGVAHMLEGYAIDEAWPAEVRGAKFYYHPGGAIRDMDELRRTLHAAHRG
jgi:hypothetical protein